MSLLKEYEEIRNRLGEERYLQITAFLSERPKYTLGDVYYRQSVWNEFEKWASEKQERFQRGFYYDLDLYKNTGAEIYKICAEYTLKKTLKMGFSELYKRLVGALEN